MPDNPRRIPQLTVAHEHMSLSCFCLGSQGMPKGLSPSGPPPPLDLVQHSSNMASCAWDPKHVSIFFFSGGRNILHSSELRPEQFIFRTVGSSVI